MRTVVSAGMLGAMILATAASPLRAQGTADERSACMGDAFRFCSADIPNVSEIETCLQGNLSALSTACQAEFQVASRTKLRPEHFSRR